MNEIINKAEIFVRDLLEKSLPEDRTFHDINHTLEVVEAATEIAENSGFGEEDREIIILAAWFHDTGYTQICKGHEKISAKYAAEFLKQNNYPAQKIEMVLSCIDATIITRTPINNLCKVLCDADLIHIGKKGYYKKSLKLKKEFECEQNKIFTELEWVKSNIDFLQSHFFYTDYAKKTYEEQRQKNLSKMKRKLRGLSDIKDKKNKPDRGVETLFRITSKNHMELSSIADNKANIMISVNALIISIVVSVLIRKLEENPELILPTVLLLLVALLTIVFATLATRPNITSGRVDREDIIKGKGNLLFFGNFYKMSLEEYEWGIEQVIKRKKYLYSMITRDIYYLGLVLQKKYRYLKITYNIFMFGLVISVLGFIAVLILKSY